MKPNHRSKHIPDIETLEEFEPSHLNELGKLAIPGAYAILAPRYKMAWIGKSHCILEALG